MGESNNEERRILVPAAFAVMAVAAVTARFLVLVVPGTVDPVGLLLAGFSDAAASCAGVLVLFLATSMIFMSPGAVRSYLFRRTGRAPGPTERRFLDENLVVCAGLVAYVGIIVLFITLESRAELLPGAMKVPVPLLFALALRAWRGTPDMAAPAGGPAPGRTGSGGAGRLAVFAILLLLAAFAFLVLVVSVGRLIGKAVPQSVILVLPLCLIALAIRAERIGAGRSSSRASHAGKIFRGILTVTLSVFSFMCVTFASGLPSLASFVSLPAISILAAVWIALLFYEKYRTRRGLEPGSRKSIPRGVLLHYRAVLLAGALLNLCPVLLAFAFRGTPSMLGRLISASTLGVMYSLVFLQYCLGEALGAAGAHGAGPAQAGPLRPSVLPWLSAMLAILFVGLGFLIYA